MNAKQLFTRLVFGCVLCLGGGVGVQAEDGVDVDARIAELEGQIEKLRAAQAELGGEEAGKHEPAVSKVELTGKQRRICRSLGIDRDQLAGLIAKPLYEFDEAEVDVYLRYLSAYERDLPKRIAHLARKNIGQPYELYLLGEMPFEHYDPQPMYSLGKSDCLVYAEHTYAMALTESWSGFMQMLQRIRYKDGQIGVATRNHYTESDWNPNNGWLVRDITADLARRKTVRFTQKVDRAKFLLKRYKLETDIPIERAQHVFIRFEDIDMAKPHLRDGDFVNIVRGMPAKKKQSRRPRSSRSSGSSGSSRPRGSDRGHIGDTSGGMRDIFGGSAWVGHTGLIVLGDDGEVHLIHSTPPQVREEPIDAYIARSTANNAARDAAGKPRLLGFKFLRLRKDPWDNLRKIDGEDAPKVTLPGGGDVDLR